MLLPWTTGVDLSLCFHQSRRRRFRIAIIVFIVAVLCSRSLYGLSRYKETFLNISNSRQAFQDGDNNNAHWNHTAETSDTETSNSTTTRSSAFENSSDFAVHDSTMAVQRFRQQILGQEQQGHQGQEKGTEWRKDPFLFGHHLAEVLTLDSVCAFGPGQGIEEDAGYKLLVEKIRIKTVGPSPSSRSSAPSSPPSPPPKLFCGVYSYSGKRSHVQVQAATWGYQCDGWRVFSNETLPEWGIVNVSHAGPESYNNMWQKVRSIWPHIYQEYFALFDYFYLGGDDVYVLVQNLRHFLGELQQGDQPIDIPRHIGQWVPGKDMIAGGPGYLLNKAALERLVLEGLPNCSTATTASYEDRLISRCLAQQLQIWGNATDTRDEKGEQRFHDASPAMLYTFRAGNGRGSSYLARTAMAWEDLPYPSSSRTRGTNNNNNNNNNSTSERRVGPKHGLAAAATYSISFHNIYNPHYMARVHAMITSPTNKTASICPPDSALGMGLREHHPGGEVYK